MEGKEKYIKLATLLFVFVLILFVAQETPAGKQAKQLTGNLSDSLENIFITDFDLQDDMENSL